MTKIALYAGSFDPPTKGHLWVIREAAELFDVLYVADGVNPQKAGRYMFSSEERTEMLKLMTKDLPNVKVISLGMRMQYQVAREVGAKWIITGERNTEDFLANLAVQNFHERQASELKTVRITPPVRIRDISSSFVKGLLGYERWEEELRREDCLPEEVYPFLVKKLNEDINCRKEE